MKSGNNPYRKNLRIHAIGSFFVLIALVFIGKAISLQIVRPSYNAPVSTTTEKVSIPAVRGELFDRNGNCLARNIYSYSLQFVSSLLTGEERTDRETIESLFDFLREKGVCSSEDIPATEETLKKLKEKGYLTIVNDLDNDLIASIKELDPVGVQIKKTVSRVYPYAGYASHILGTTGLIHKEDLAYYSELNYPMDSIVGITGAELAFEKELHGTDGVLQLEKDASGRVISSKIMEEPVPGKNVVLTIDINLQIAAEDSLAATIDSIRENGTQSGKSRNGEDCRSGAFVAIEPTTNGILAIASHPTYDLNTYNADYASLLENSDNPLYNRALSGTFAPGSVFKPGIAAAALEYGIINEYDTVDDTGVYLYYAPDYTPRCWFYTSYGVGHGKQNVTQAIQNSCNYFFYDVGRRLGIDRMNEYCSLLGLGQSTGVELKESKGVLAGPSSRENSALGPWNPGDTLQAAIGQIDNAFTPLQLAVYFSTILNGGERYAAHIFNKTTIFYSNETIKEYDPLVLSRAQLSDNTRRVLKNAMRNVMEDGTASRLFAD